MPLTNAQKYALFESAFYNSAIGMGLVAPDGRWELVNQSLCDLVGYTKAELEALTFQDITHPADLGEDLAHVQAMRAGKIRHYRMEKRYLHKKGHDVWVLLSVSAIYKKNGDVHLFISQIQDITAMKQALLLQEELIELMRTQNRQMQRVMLLAGGEHDDMRSTYDKIQQALRHE